MAIKLTDLQLIYGDAGAREKFEDLCSLLIHSEYSNLEKIRVMRGDGGIDACRGSLSSKKHLSVFQVKYFPHSIGKSQRDQIRKSFNTIQDNTDIRVDQWTLCIPINLSIDEKQWFDDWKEKQVKSGIKICQPWSALKLVALLYEDKNVHIKEEYFNEKYHSQIRDMHGIITQKAEVSEQRAQNQKRIAEAFSDFIIKGQQLHARLDEDPLPIKDHNDWVDSVGEYLRNNLGRDYEVRFSDFSGLVFYGDSSDKSKMNKSIEGRIRRLQEFLSEIRKG